MVSRRPSRGRRRLGDSGESNVETEPAIGSALDAYLGHLWAASMVEVGDDGVECLTLPFWSLPATKEAAVKPDSNLIPWCRLYVRCNGPDWVVSDGGENLAVVLECNPDFDLQDGGFQQFLSGNLVSSGPSNSLRVSSEAGLEMGEGVAVMVRAISVLDTLFTDMISDAFGPTSTGEISVFDLDGEGIRFSDRIVRQADIWVSESFALSRGALAVTFTHQGRQGSDAALVRDEPGIFDEPTTLFELGEEGTGVGLWRVAEGEWRDPHPEVNYHLEVSGWGDFECLFLQPDLGQAAVQFPYSTGGSGGATIAGPFRVGSRPILANLRHDGGGRFFVELVSLDGAHECEVISTDGQVHLDDYPVEVKPGKEYLLYTGAGGNWELELTEGY